MTLEKLDLCCKCPDHQKPYRNEDGWVLTGDPDNFDSLQAWLPDEWQRHCDRVVVQRKGYQRRYHAKDAA